MRRDRRALLSATLLLGVLSYPLLTFGQSLDRNYIISNTVRVGGVKDDASLRALSSDKSKVQSTIQYADGLGRGLQTVQRMGSPLGYDVVTPNEYDQYGREVKKYLPYIPSGSTAGGYQASAVAGVGSYYTTPPSGIASNPAPYSVTGLEASPLGRPEEIGAPGAAWQLGGGHTVRMDYRLNNSITWASDSVNSRRVSLFHVIINSDNSRSLARYSNAVYPDNSLTVTVSKDENWVSGRAGTTEEYKDQEGHVVLKRAYNYKNASVKLERLSTYYVYDDKGNLCYVLPPETNADEDIAITSQTISKLGYEYWYDALGRPYRKKLPGKGWDFTVYNALDQVAMTQDANQRAKMPQEWTFTKYDALGRVVITGIYQYGGSIADTSLYTPSGAGHAWLQSYYDNPSLTAPNWETRDNSTTTGYNNASTPVGTGYTFLSITLYDDYSATSLAPAAYSAPYGASQSVRGLPTQQYTNVLGTSTMLTTMTYYDSDARPLKVYKQHYLGGVNNTGNYDAISTTYDFTNAPTTVSRQHFTSANAGTPLHMVNVQYIYDHAGRKLKTWQQVYNSGTATPRMLISKSGFNEIGQLQDKWLHSTDSVNFYEQVTYTYNQRGWLKKQSSGLFEEELFYETGTNKAYNGNIMYQFWGTGANPNTSYYTYLYDKLDRLASGARNDNSSIEQGITYDKQGNITALQRTLNGTLADNLTYVYGGGNQLQSVTDATSNNAGQKSGTTSFAGKYDPNGNLVADPGKGVTGIVYNLVNLPKTVTFAGSTINYTYDASGAKLRRVSTAGSGTTTEYIDGIQYTGNTTTIDLIQTEEGQAFREGASYNYEYFLADHLGNTRVMFDTKMGYARKVQSDDYLPFGMQVLGQVNSPSNKYLYNKKELQDELAQYDYGARFYDPVIGRWTSVDPLAEETENLSIYNYVENNPISKTDLDGRSSQDFSGASPSLASTYVDRTGKIIRHLNDHDNSIYLVDGIGPQTRIGTERQGTVYKPGELLTIRDILPSMMDQLPKDFKFKFGSVLIFDPKDRTSMQKIGIVPTYVITGGAGIALKGAREAYKTLDLVIDLWTAMNLMSKGGPRNIWPDQYGYPPNPSTVDWGKSDSQLADDLSKKHGDKKRGGGTPNNMARKWFRDKRPK